MFQFLDPSSQAWHAFRTANRTCLGIEHEGSGEAWTELQLDASAHLAAWLCRMYNIPVKKVDPRDPQHRADWCGFFGHGDLVGIDGNDHTDTVPKDTGWPTYLTRVSQLFDDNGPEPLHAPPPHDGTLRLVLEARGKPRRAWAGWADATGPLRWIATKGLLPDTDAALAFQGKVARGPQKVESRAKELVEKFLTPGPDGDPSPN